MRYSGNSRLTPLQVMAGRLVAGPPSISRIIMLIKGADSVRNFIELVKEYLPERQKEILRGGPNLELFARYFSEKYFPLDIDPFVEDEALEYMENYIPVGCEGWSEDDYTSISLRAGFTLAWSLMESPYTYGQGNDGGRTALLEKVAHLTAPSLVERIPLEGYPAEVLHAKFDRTEYEGIASIADVLFKNTGTYFLDTSIEDEYGSIEWDRGNVDRLTMEWRRSEAIWEKVMKMVKWLEESPFHRLRKLLNIIQDTPDIPKEQMPLPLVFEREEENGQSEGQAVAVF